VNVEARQYYPYAVFAVHIEQRVESQTLFFLKTKAFKIIVQSDINQSYVVVR